MEWDSYNNLLHQLQVGAQKDILKSLQLPKKKKKLTNWFKALSCVYTVHRFDFQYLYFCINYTII